MSTLEKTIDLLHALPENQAEVIYSFVQFLSSQQETENPAAEESLDEIREIRNYWCNQCYIDFHYIEDPQEHEEAFQKVAVRLHEDELRVFALQQKIEKLRKSVERKHGNKKREMLQYGN